MLEPRAVSEQARKRIIQVIIGAVVGLSVGFAAGYWFWPVEYTNTAPTVLRQDYHNDYVVMVATAYEVEGDLERARERLKLLDPEEPAAPVVELAERLVEAGSDTDDITRLVRLAWALDATTSTLIPYLEGPP